MRQRLLLRTRIISQVFNFDMYRVKPNVALDDPQKCRVKVTKRRKKLYRRTRVNAVCFMGNLLFNLPMKQLPQAPTSGGLARFAAPFILNHGVNINSPNMQTTKTEIRRYYLWTTKTHTPRLLACLLRYLLYAFQSLRIFRVQGILILKSSNKQSQRISH